MNSWAVFRSTLFVTIYIPIWLDYEYGVQMNLISSNGDLHSNMVRL